MSLEDVTISVRFYVQEQVQHTPALNHFKVLKVSFLSIYLLLANTRTYLFVTTIPYTTWMTEALLTIRYALIQFPDHMHWPNSMNIRIDPIPWPHALTLSLGHTHWPNSLITRIDPNPWPYPLIQFPDHIRLIKK